MRVEKFSRFVLGLSDPKNVNQNFSFRRDSALDPRDELCSFVVCSCVLVCVQVILNLVRALVTCARESERYRSAHSKSRAAFWKFDTTYNCSQEKLFLFLRSSFLH